MIKKQLEQDLKKVVEELGYESSDIVCYIPQNLQFGDYATNIALQLSKQKLENSKQSPQEIAKEITDKLNNLDYLEKIEIAGPGFINFFIKDFAIQNQLLEILRQGNKFGQLNIGKGKSINVEFISANPTGPLTLPNGRGGAIGDTLANVLNFAGYSVEREYYVNDTGNQVRLLGESVLASLGRVEKKEEHYQGEYIKDLALKFKDQVDLPALELGQKIADYLLEHEIKPAIARLGIKYDLYYSERSIYERGLIQKTVEILKNKKVAYEKDGALWLRSSEYGDDQDRVLITSKEKRGHQEPTYLLPDLAHHIDILSRGFTKKINVLGADHHGYVSRLKAGVGAAGFPGMVEVILMQMVKLFSLGKEVRMSKRAGNFVTLDELLDTVGKDATRFFLLMYSPDSPINFNMDLAREKSNKNPVYYVQYAYARMINIMKKAGDLTIGKDLMLDKLITKEESSLVKHLGLFPSLVEEIESSFQVQRLTSYAYELADKFHKFYEVSPVIGASDKETKAVRLALVKASQIVLKNTLGLLGVTAPERM